MNNFHRKIYKLAMFHIGDTDEVGVLARSILDDLSYQLRLSAAQMELMTDWSPFTGEGDEQGG